MRFCKFNAVSNNGVEKSVKPKFTTKARQEDKPKIKKATTKKEQVVDKKTE